MDAHGEGKARNKQADPGEDAASGGGGEGSANDGAAPGVHEVGGGNTRESERDRFSLVAIEVHPVLPDGEPGTRSETDHRSIDEP
ncbi:unannotated protein [freshwater metagenome]|uniref:Unannotated protein n=1 Tax=freshwater metagenome TaxID=449393 RepID=A0A6J6RJS6_9ZZZZ